MTSSPYRFRVFLSYAHADQPLVARIASVLERIGLHALWDADINAGKPFTDEIKDLIARSHLFLPVITPNSSTRPWVHQEIGYAVALGIPVLPLSIGGIPTEMISQVQAISVKKDLSDLVERMGEINLLNLITPKPTRPFGLVEIAEWPEQRPEYIVRYCNWVSNIEGYVPIRLQARFTIFATPDADISDPIWDKREGNDRRSHYMRHWLREERRVMESYARVAGCKIIFDPRAMTYETQGAEAKISRLRALIDFISNMPPDKLEIVSSERAQDTNLIIVGDYFAVESKASRAVGYVQTIFNSHPPTVLQRLQDFDQLFSELHTENPMTVADVIDTLDQLLVQS